MKRFQRAEYWHSIHFTLVRLHLDDLLLFHRTQREPRPTRPRGKSRTTGGAGGRDRAIVEMANLWGPAWIQTYFLQSIENWRRFGVVGRVVLDIRR